MSIYNDLTGLRWLRKCFRSRGGEAEVGPGSWAGGQLFCALGLSPQTIHEVDVQGLALRC
jgi:hypothetical protein